MIKFRLLLALFCLTAFTLAGCSDDKDKDENPPVTTKNAVYLESVSGTILPMEGAESLSAILTDDFADRFSRGQTMTVQIGRNVGQYVYQNDVWIPKTKPVAFAEGESQAVKITISGAGLQDGTANGLLRADELVYTAAAQKPVAHITDVKFDHSNSLVFFTFPGSSPTGDIISSFGSKAYWNEANGSYALFTEPGTGKFTIDYYERYEILTGEIKNVEERFEPSRVYNVTVREDIGMPAKPTFTNFISYTGPFIFYTDYGTVNIVGGYLAAEADGNRWNYIETEYEQVRSVNVYSSDLSHRFKVTLHDTPSDQFIFAQPEKVVVAADMHGHLDAFVDILRSQGVIDEYYKWSFGTNYLVVNGDTFDRGRDDLAILWLLYKLEKEAEEAGGKCIYIIGNHDDLVLRADLRYINADHSTFASQYGGETYLFDRMWTESTELGRWIRSRNLMVRVGDDVFLHAGVHVRFAEQNFTIGEINQLTKENTGKGSRSGRASTIFATSTDDGGLLWYRGMIYQTITQTELSTVLSHFDCDRFILGHTEVNDIAWLYDGRVIGVNVPHKDNWANRFKSDPTEQSGALLIEDGDYYMIDYRGNRTRLNP